MKVGVPTEVKPDEYRVALTPAGARELGEHGHEAIVQAGAGEGSAIADADYAAQGARIAADAEAVWEEAELVLGVKEPQPEEVGLLRAEHTLFTYLHLAPAPDLTQALCDSGATCVAYETVEDAHGRLPLLAPMSEVAGKIATQAGAFMLERPLGGRGVLLGGVPGVAAANVMVIGGGVVGFNAAKIAIGMDADVFVYDRNVDRLRELDVAFAGRASTVYSSTLAVEEMLPRADLVIGAVLVHGARAAGDDAAAVGDRRRVDRPGRLLRDLAADDALRPDVRGRRHHALLRGEHARGGARDVDLRADQRDDAVPAAPRRRGRAPRARRRPGLHARAERRGGPADLPGGRARPGPRLHPARRRPPSGPRRGSDLAIAQWAQRRMR